MAAKVGKREKIIVGLVIGIAAIAAVHILVFQARGKKFDDLKRDRDGKRQEAESLASVNPQDKQQTDEFTSETAVAERVLWQAVLDMDLIPPIFCMTSEKEPEKPDPKDAAASQQYNKDLADYRKRTDPLQIAGEAALTARFERLMEIDRNYEAGAKWKGDIPKQGDPGTNIVKLSFIREGPPGANGTPENGWNLPVELPKSLTPGASLWDEVNRLYERWQVLSLMSPGADGYSEAEADYIAQLKAMGLDKDLFPSIKELNQFLPEFLKMLHARMIWRHRKEGETIRVGRQDLTFDLLKQMYDVRLPRIANPDTTQEIANLNRQLEALEMILPLARRDKIEEIQIVQLPKIRPIGACDLKAVEDAKKAPEAQASPTPRSLLPASGITGSSESMIRAAAGEAKATGASVSWGGPTGFASLITMRYVTTNENAIRFLYDLITDPFYFRIDGLSFYGLENQRVMVDVSIDATIAVFGVSLPGELVDTHGKPLTKVGEEMLAARKAQMQNDPSSIDKIVQDALVAAGLPANVLETLATPPPTPVPTPAARPGGAPAMAASPSASGESASPTRKPLLPANLE